MHKVQSVAPGYIHGKVLSQWYLAHPCTLNLCTPFAGYNPRTGEEHRRLCIKYRGLRTEKEQEEFFSKFGVRYTAFAELDYFDIVKWTVVDPMHNLFLGADFLG